VTNSGHTDTGAEVDELVAVDVDHYGAMRASDVDGEY